jgi:iron complex outermembrane receptor protein
MKLGVTKLSSAVRLALSLGAVIAAGASGSVFAQDSSAAPADATSQPAKKTTSLDTVVVTGSNIRRVDLETSNPVQVIDRAAIQASGKVTLGDLIQEIPSVSGDATNPRVNNGGGAGSSTVSLRGLGSARTLILVNGKRVVNNDVNAIPASMVERIEVLKDGASAVYGSDAIGGVVNFILRNDYQGAQISTNFGQSDRADGDTSGYTATFGTSSDKGNIVAGIDYNKTDEISSAARNFSKNATYFSSGSVYNGGSSRTPGGYLQLPAGSGLTGCAGNGNGNATLSSTQPGKVTAANYRCYTGADGYNYQAENLIETPQERTNVFTLANYNFSDNVQGYFDAFYNKTSSQYALAPLPFDAQTDGVTISPNSYYNPYPGTTFGPGANEYKTRLTTLGQRITTYSTTTAQAIAGLKGNFGTDSSWQWNADIDYGHVSQSKESLGQLYLNGLQSSGAFGPSFLNPATGVVTCGTAAAPIANCTPINIFNVNDPKTIAALKAYAANAFYDETYISKRYEAGANGNLFSLPAGEVSLAVGVDYDKEYENNGVDYIATTTGASGTCFISQSACSTPLAGGYNYKEAYAELFVPILADVPFVKSLNVTVGGRYSDYSLAGSTTNYKFAVEWRPFSDLLLRGTMEGVFFMPAARVALRR